MNHATYFNTFLADEVNINEGRLTTLKSRVEAVYSALKDDDVLGSYVLGKIPQGSWPHRTIIKPRTDGEFDADFLLELNEHDGWEPKDYLNAVYNALGRNAIYADQPKGRSCRAVYLTYAPKDGVACHLDIVPFVHLSDGRLVIVNKDDNQWEDTDPQGFTDWMKERDDITGGNFRKVVRLLKYIKRERGSFDGVRSVVLTVVAGMPVEAWRKLGAPGYYGDVPTTLVHVLEDLNSWLRANPTKPSVPNPGGGTSTFDQRWEQNTYSNFRDRIKAITGDARAALDEPDEEKSIAAWQKVLGDKFNPPRTKKSAAAGRFGTVPVVGVASSSGKAG